MKPLDAFLAGVASIVIIAFLVMIIVKQNESKPAEQPPGIFLDDTRINRMHIIKDTRRNLQWDAIGIDRALVIIPGTEKPIKTAP